VPHLVDQQLQVFDSLAARSQLFALCGECLAMLIEFRV